jgi:general secretion pathway protein F
MPIFHYKGYKGDGSAAAGTIEADSLQAAVSTVKERNIFPKEVTEHVHRQSAWRFSSNNLELLPAVTRQLSTLLSAGVPLMDALRSLSEENRGFWRSLLVEVRERVASGASLSRALEGYPAIFPDFYTAMVAAGEQSGTLDKILERLADYLEKQSAIKAKVRISLIYPVFMMVVGFVVLSFLFVFVIPKIVKIFENTKNALPLITVLLIAVSNLFVHYWWIMLGMIMALGAGMKNLNEKRRDLIDAWLLRIPGNVVQSLCFSRFSRTLGFLLEGGLPMLTALDLASKSVGNLVLEKSVDDAAKKVAEGGRLSSSIEGFPPVLLQLIATGEKSGKLATILGKAADSYEEEFGRRVQKLLSLLEPGMIVFMGVVVCLIVLAVLLPMFQLNQLIK